MEIILFIAGIVLGWLISHVYYVRAKQDSEKAAAAQAKATEEHSRMLRTLLEVAEEQGQVELHRDAKGNITGGRNIRINVETAHLGLTGYAPTVMVADADRERR